MEAKPNRIQRKRTKGWRMPDGAVYVGRPSRWGNPFRAGHAWYPTGWNSRGKVPADAAEAVKFYRQWMSQSRARNEDLIPMLRGKDLVCWCPLDQPCHADVLVEWAND